MWFGVMQLRSSLGKFGVTYRNSHISSYQPVFFPRWGRGVNVAKCNPNRTFCGLAAHQKAPPIYYWSTDALNGACAKSLSSTRNLKEEGSSSCGYLGH
ncbi:hypothetical protein AVEN_72484-1 [Araneus ventricosus]|uniref:Uncharacterized protein n=1 Tax=Araneus ventricosus TaxID=182803 RepID=A0A4Y2G4P6_ARAVE|nr:hypothetical protein AVEN_72484-1 [Araneus ventricosus]